MASCNAVSSAGASTRVAKALVAGVQQRLTLPSVLRGWISTFSGVMDTGLNRTVMAPGAKVARWVDSLCMCVSLKLSMNRFCTFHRIKTMVLGTISSNLEAGASVKQMQLTHLLAIKEGPLWFGEMTRRGTRKGRPPITVFGVTVTRTVLPLFVVCRSYVESSFLPDRPSLSGNRTTFNVFIWTDYHLWRLRWDFFSYWIL